MKLVALDLETTGLDSKVDTIIEIAAIKFSLVKQWNTFEVQDVEERTMLIDPERPIDEEISLITGILPQMLAGKKTWKNVQEKVRNFIGDLPIVGHNILFDKAILEAHGFDLKDTLFLDTFELASILSSEASSLNLGFLADFYNIKKRWDEHRALTDTWIAVDLFCLLLEEITKWSQREKIIWNTVMKITDDPCLKKIAEITENILDTNPSFTLEEGEQKRQEKWENTQFLKNHTFHTYNIFSPCEKEEKKFFTSKWKSTLIVRNRDEAKNIQERLDTYSISNTYIPSKSSYISLPTLKEVLDWKWKYSRKMAILIARLIFWREQKQTENLDGFRAYWEEYELLPIFCMKEDEDCSEYHQKIQNSHHTQITLVTAHTFAQDKQVYSDLIYKDATLLEWILRQAFSKRVSFGILFKKIETLTVCPCITKIKEYLQIMESLYLQSVQRPSGPDPFPPWNFGETYVIDQETLWWKHSTSLVLWTKKLWETSKEWNQNFQTDSVRESAAQAYITASIRTLCQYHLFLKKDIYAIISIRNENTAVQYISSHLNTLLQESPGEYMDYTRENPSGNDFIKNTYHAHAVKTYTHPEKIVTQASYKKVTAKKTVILTTSLRHIREIHEELSSFCDHEFLVQGISGWKEKMLYNFQQASSAVLVGLIESWRDKSELWKHAWALFIAKVPFDPPSDPYFLVKTKTMQNNFDGYSIPLVIARINTLVGNARLANPDLQVFCSDARLSKSKWGKKVSENLL